MATFQINLPHMSPKLSFKSSGRRKIKSWIKKSELPFPKQLLISKKKLRQGTEIVSPCKDNYYLRQEHDRADKEVDGD